MMDMKDMVFRKTALRSCYEGTSSAYELSDLITKHFKPCG